jgi:hypothetical protein
VNDYFDIGPDIDLLCQAAEMAAGGYTLTRSNVQRRLRVGFAKAAHLLDLLEHYDVISPMDSHGVRRPNIGICDLPKVVEELRRKAAVPSPGPGDRP